MNVLALLVVALAAYALGVRFYAPRLARAFGEDDARRTPAVVKDDGVDYVPTRTHVLFAHHFSAIAAAGPILGPTIALIYGAFPVWAWIVAGGIFLGAAHDFACLFVSVRSGGRSIAEIARTALGGRAYVLFVLFLIFNLVVVNATFLNLTARSLVSTTPLADLRLPADQTLFGTAEVGGALHARVGGIASTSAIALTVVAPLLGWLVVRRNLRERLAYPLATLLCVGSVLIGFALPVTLDQETWIYLLCAYVVIAAAAPVWTILQPREFVSVQFLYLGIILLFLSVAAMGLRGLPLQAPGWNAAAGEVSGAIWPTLFITVACGAISGFHGLVGSGTTSKQVARESDCRRVGYSAMIGESVLAMVVTLAVAAGLPFASYEALRANPPLAFSRGVAGALDLGLGIPPAYGVVFGLLMVEGFVLDTLDVSIRLNRYLLEEVWTVVFGATPRALKSYWLNAGVSAALMVALARRQEAQRLWQIFGTGNQLLAALTLLTISVWLYRERRRVAYTLVPAVLVGGTTLASLVTLAVTVYWPKGDWMLCATAAAFLALALGVAASAVAAVWGGRGAEPPRESGAGAKR